MNGVTSCDVGIKRVSGYYVSWDVDLLQKSKSSLTWDAVTLKPEVPNRKYSGTETDTHHENALSRTWFTSWLYINSNFPLSHTHTHPYSMYRDRIQRFPL